MMGDQIPSLILAAGIGERLGHLTKSTPKSLIPLDDKGHGSLAILLHQLQKLRTPEIYVVGGFCFDMIASFLANFPQFEKSIHLIDARPDYVRGPIYSFLSAHLSLRSVPLFYLFPADTLFHPGIFEFLATTNWIEQTVHLLLKSPAPIQKSTSWKSLAAIMYPIVCLPGFFFESAATEIKRGGTKVMEALQVHIDDSNKYKIHIIPTKWVHSIDIDTETHLHQASEYIHKWGISF